MACPLVEVFGGWYSVAARSLVRSLAGGHVPQLDRLVPTPRGQGLAVRAVRHGEHHFRVPREGGPLLAGGHVPQLDRLVPTPRGQGLAVRAVRHGDHRERVSREGGLLLAGGHVPQADFAWLAAQTTPRGQPL